VDKAGATMTEVVGAIRRVTHIMAEISAASSQQSLGVAQVGEAVAQVDRATQQNAALVEEIASSATRLSSQAEALVTAVEVFKLTRAERAAPEAFAETVVEVRANGNTVLPPVVRESSPLRPWLAALR
jgi:hypothetical protein